MRESRRECTREWVVKEREREIGSSGEWVPGTVG